MGAYRIGGDEGEMESGVNTIAPIVVKACESSMG